MEEIRVAEKRLSDYRAIIGGPAFAEILALASKLKGKRVAHVIIHDPQPAPFATLCERKGRWIWRCHIDLTSPNPSVLRLLTPHLEAYDAAVFSAREYAPPTVQFPRIYVNPPAIDPTSPKNRHVYREELETILPRFDVDFDRPVITQVGRFDPWKDPLGVIDAYRLVKKKVPRVQLLMVASTSRESGCRSRTVDMATSSPASRSAPIGRSSCFAIRQSGRRWGWRGGSGSAVTS